MASRLRRRTRLPGFLGRTEVKKRPLEEGLRFCSQATTFSVAMLPVNTAIMLKVFEIIGTNEGQVPREKLLADVLELRGQTPGRTSPTL